MYFLSCFWKTTNCVLIHLCTSLVNVKCGSFMNLLPEVQHKKILFLKYQKNQDICISSVQFSRSVVSDSLRPHESQHTRPPCPSPTPRVHPNSRPSSRLCHPATHLLLSPSPPAPNPSQHQSLFQWVNSSHEVAKVLDFELQHQSFQRTPRTDLL